MDINDFNKETIEEIAYFYGVDVDDLEASGYLDDVIVWYGCDDMTDVAYDYIHEVYVLDEVVYNYFDYEKFGRDLDIEGYFFSDGQGNMVELR